MTAGSTRRQGTPGSTTACVVLPARLDDSSRSLHAGCLGLAAVVARAGRRVTVAGLEDSRPHPSAWAALDAMGVRFASFPRTSAWAEHGSADVWHAIRFFEWLRRKSFHELYATETGGIAYFALLARHQQLALRGLQVRVGVLAPTAWRRERSPRLIPSVDEVLVDQLERGVVQMADAVWSPSSAMVRWMRRREWRLPRSVEVLPLPAVDEPTWSSRRSTAPVRRIVFVGDVDESRSHVQLFCRAVSLLAERRTQRLDVVFLGRPGQIGEVSVEHYLRQQHWQWSLPAGHSTLAHVSSAAGVRAGDLAVVLPRSEHAPALLAELSSAGVPFIVPDDEFVSCVLRQAERDQLAVPLHAVDLAARMERALTEGALIATPRMRASQREQRWTLHLRRPTDSAPQHGRATRRSARQPLVSVCMTTHNRPQLLRHALQSLRRQDYSPLEVVLVDDSTDSQSAAAVDRLRPGFRRRGWQLEHRQDRHVGAARNRAARLARGEFLFFMDDDNVAKPREISIMVQALLAGGADIVTCFLDVFENHAGRPSPADRAFVWPFIGGDRASALFRNVLGDTNCLMRRTTFVSLGGFREDEGIGFEDWELFARAVSRGYRVEPVPLPLVWFRRSGGGMSGRFAGAPEHSRVARSLMSGADPRMAMVAEIAKASEMRTGWAAGDAGAFDASHVRTVVVFGAGPLGQRILELCGRAGWRVLFVADNNPQMWGQTVAGCEVRPAQALSECQCDLVVVASVAHFDAIVAQLAGWGFARGRSIVGALDAFVVGGVRMRLEQ